jgi:hypothetical protein
MAPNLLPWYPLIIGPGLLPGRRRSAQNNVLDARPDRRGVTGLLAIQS